MDNKCRFCSKPINPNSIVKLCYKCDRETMEKIKQYIIEHPGSKAPQIAKGINLDDQTMMEYLDDDRFDFKSVCSICNNEFNGIGDYCPKCSKRRSLILQLNDAYQKDDNNKKPINKGPKWHLR